MFACIVHGFGAERIKSTAGVKSFAVLFLEQGPVGGLKKEINTNLHPPKTKLNIARKADCSLAQPVKRTCTENESKLTT